MAGLGEESELVFVKEDLEMEEARNLEFPDWIGDEERGVSLGGSVDWETLDFIVCVRVCVDCQGFGILLISVDLDLCGFRPWKEMTLDNRLGFCP